MDRTERVALLHGLLTHHRYGLSNERLMREAGCSRTTLYRDLSFMRDTLGAPLEHEGDPARIWRYVGSGAGGFQLPGVWLSADELYALMLAQQVLQRSGGGLLGQALGPLQPRIHKLLGDRALRLDRLRVLRAQARPCDPSVFRIVTESVLDARQLRFRYQARSTAQESERVVSPQRLTHHRDNWYLDAWGESAREDAQQPAPTNARGDAEGRTAARSTMRRFALDRIKQPQLCAEASIDVPVEELDASQEAGYGIFAGPAVATAVIRFTPHAARWIADEVWHPAQKRRTLPDGSLELTLPYANPRELLMDVQRYGADAEVIRPLELRVQMREMLVAALGQYPV